MADLFCSGSADLDISKALVALKKGTQLLKYGRKGKPKVYPFRLSNDESSVIWFSSSGGKNLKLASASRIISGQRTDGKELISNSHSDSSIGTLVDSPGDNLNTSISLKDRSFENLIHLEKSDAANMQIKGASSDVIRVRVSSAPSTSSHGSAQDDTDAYGDVYVWGEIISDTSSREGADRNVYPYSSRTDILLPKPLESNVVLDILHVSCGARHAALVTRQGEVFTWGEECGGRLGHGVGTDAIHPRLVESLYTCNIDFVACGEFHTCAVSAAGELYTWGDGTHKAGILGHGTNVSHWMPKRVSGPLEGIQIASVTCGTWHTALITITGQLFTFGDGTFGVLGHGNRECILYPKEVESLMGLKTTAVSCGLWHTAAVVEVIMTQSSTSFGKLFTWGDGDKYCLGHGDKEPRLKPTCVPSLIDHSFYKVACGHGLTIGLTTSGLVFTMGSTVYGQLGNPYSDGKRPCLVEDKLVGQSIVEVACGSYHVAVLTTRSEVYTWGKGANGRLGHGDLEDRKTPTFVEALKDRPIKRIACGSNFTAAICHHKWVSGAEQSQCSACRQAFGFTRKRHNCYNCGLVHCHSCSLRKAVRAALSPNPGKPYRVCDTCYVKLNKVESSGVNSKKNGMPRLSGESKDRPDKADNKFSKISSPSNLDLIKNLDIKAAKHGKKSESLSLIGTPRALPLLQLKDVAFGSGINLHRAIPRPIYASVIQSLNHSRAVSPVSRKSSPPRSATPIPTTSGLSFSRSSADNLKKTNALLCQEVHKLHAQVDSLRQRCEFQEFELHKSTKKAQDAIILAAEESAKSKSAKEVTKSLTAQLKDMAERLPYGEYDTVRPMCPSNGIEMLVVHHSNLTGEHLLRDDGRNHSLLSATTVQSSLTNGISDQKYVQRDNGEANGTGLHIQNHMVGSPNGVEEDLNSEGIRSGDMPTSSSGAEVFERKEPEQLQNGDGSKLRSPTSASNHVEGEWIEQYEPGVYITLFALGDGTRDLKRVRFSRRRFREQQAETWWSENRERVYEKYSVSDMASATPSIESERRSYEGFLPSS